MFNRIWRKRIFLCACRFYSSTIKQINFYSFGFFSCACAVASHYDAVSVDAQEFFVFIISTEKPQAAKPKAITSIGKYMCGTKSDHGQCLRRQKSIWGVNKINFQLIPTKNHKVSKISSYVMLLSLMESVGGKKEPTNVFLNVPFQLKRAEANHSEKLVWR